MLNQSVVNIAHELANEFTVRGFTLVAQPESPLQKLNSTVDNLKPIKPVQSAVLGENSDETAYTPETLVYAASGFDAHLQGQAVDHEEVIDQFVTAVSESVQNHLSFAKNTVKPLVAQAIEEVSEKIEALRPDPYQGWKIVKTALPAVLKDSSLFDSFDKFIVNYDIEPKNLNLDLFPALSYDQIVEIVSEGSGLTEEINLMLSQMDSNAVVSLFQNVFSGGYNDTINLNKPENATLIYLACNRLIEDLPENTKVNLTAYTTGVSAVRSHVAKVLKAAATTYNAHMDIGLLLKSFDARTNECLVYEETYARFREKEANHDGLIFAATLMNRTPRYLGEFEEQYSELVKAWKSFELMLTTTYANKRYSTYREIYANTVLEIASKNLEQVQSNLSANLNPQSKMEAFQTLKSKVVQQTESFTSGELDDIASACLKLMAGICFDYTGAYDILKNIQKATEVNPDLDAQEAALISTIEYVCQYVFDQIVIQG